MELKSDVGLLESSEISFVFIAIPGAKANMAEIAGGWPSISLPKVSLNGPLGLPHSTVVSRESDFAPRIHPPCPRSVLSGRKCK